MHHVANKRKNEERFWNNHISKYYLENKARQDKVEHENQQVIEIEKEGRCDQKTV